jgi:hypothetical protein
MWQEGSRWHLSLLARVLVAVVVAVEVAVEVTMAMAMRVLVRRVWCRSGARIALIALAG